MMKPIIYSVLLISIIKVQILISTPSEPDYYRYLQQYGYTPKVEGRRLFSVVSESSYSEGIKTLQRLYKLPITGKLDEKTKKFMQRSRCGNPDLGTVHSIRQPLNVDKPESVSSSRGRSSKAREPEKYSTQLNSWPQKHIKWFIEEYPKLQKEIKSEDDVRRIMRQAFVDWEKYSGLTFEMVDNKKNANLKIRFAAKDHGDSYAFDGPGVTLAHAFYPQSGDIHFDNDESFTDDYKDKDGHYTLRLVAAHEIGHALGLSHSYDEKSLMFPVYQQFNSNYNISESDQEGIQKLYGKPDSKSNVQTTATKTTPTPSRTTHSSSLLPTNHWCAGEFETGCEGPDGDLYLFKDNQAWRYSANKKRSWDPRPKLIIDYFPSLNDMTISACVRSTSGNTYLFRNYRTWKLPTPLSATGPYVLRGKNYPQNPRIALFHRNTIYLVRDHLIYRLHESDYERDLEIDTIDSILNPPPPSHEHIQSGFTYKKRHYIFTRKSVYVYDSTQGNLLSGYPKAATNGWFACEKASQPSNWNEKTTAVYRQNNERENHHHHHRHHDDYHHDDHHHRRRPASYRHRNHYYHSDEK